MNCLRTLFAAFATAFILTNPACAAATSLYFSGTIQPGSYTYDGKSNAVGN